MVSGLKSEMAKHLLDDNVSTFSMAPVKVCGFIILKYHNSIFCAVFSVIITFLLPLLFGAHSFCVYVPEEICI